MSLIFRSDKQTPITPAEYDANLQYLLDCLKGLDALENPTADRLLAWDQSAGGLAFFGAGAGLAFDGENLATTGILPELTLPSGPTITAIETAVTDDDARLPTSGAVHDALANKVNLAGDTMTGDLALNKAAGSNINLFWRQAGSNVGATFFRYTDKTMGFRSYDGDVLLVAFGKVIVSKDIEPLTSGINIGATQEFDNITCVSLTETSGGDDKIFVGPSLGSQFLNLLSPRVYRRVSEVVPEQYEIHDEQSHDDIAMPHWGGPTQRYSWFEPARAIERSRWHHGFYAEEIVWSLEECGVSDAGKYGLHVKTPNGKRGLRYTQWAPILVRGHQELTDLVEAMMDRVSDLEADRSCLQEQVEILARRVVGLERRAAS